MVSPAAKDRMFLKCNPEINDGLYVFVDLNYEYTGVVYTNPKKNQRAHEHLLTLTTTQGCTMVAERPDSPVRHEHTSAPIRFRYVPPLW